MEEEVASKMLYLSKQKKLLQEKIKSEGLDRRSCKWEINYCDMCVSISMINRGKTSKSNNSCLSDKICTMLCSRTSG